jgi:16S rRNA (cytosine967-C5)-methyltransferase
MRAGGRLAAAIEVLADIETRRRPVSEALKDWGTSHRFAGSGDRAAIGNLVYDALRWRASTAWVMADESPRALVLGAVVRHWDGGVEELSRRLADDPHAPAPLMAEETQRFAESDLSSAPDHIRADVPEWLAPRMERAFGGDWVAEGGSLALRPPLDMRVNRLKADRPKVLKALSRFAAAETAHSPDGMRIAPTSGDGRHPNVQVEPAFQKGWFEIQDEGSQVAALMVGAKAGEQVLDLCSGGGGKTLALAAAMGNKGQVMATDSDRSRLAPIFDRLRRAGTRNVQVRDAGGSLTDLEGRMDAVLVDAPCTGTGTWRRRPDAKWRLTERALGERIAEQSALLVDAARYVKPGGRLVYVTCSFLPDENDDRIADFLAGATGFGARPPEKMISAAGLPAEFTDSTHLAEKGILLSPRKTGTDAFFIAVMERSR